MNAKPEGNGRRHLPRPVTRTGAFKWNWSLLVVFVFFCFCVIANIGYTNKVQHESNQKNREALATSEQVWCGVLLNILAPDAGPPTTERAWQVYVGLADLMRRYGCQTVPTVPPKPSPRAVRPAASPSTTEPSRR